MSNDLLSKTFGCSFSPVATVAAEAPVREKRGRPRSGPANNGFYTSGSPRPRGTPQRNADGRELAQPAPANWSHMYEKVCQLTVSGHKPPAIARIIGYSDVWVRTLLRSDMCRARIRELNEEWSRDFVGRMRKISHSALDKIEDELLDEDCSPRFALDAVNSFGKHPLFEGEMAPPPQTEDSHGPHLHIHMDALNEAREIIRQQAAESEVVVDGEVIARGEDAQS